MNIEEANHSVFLTVKLLFAVLLISTIIGQPLYELVNYETSSIVQIIDDINNNDKEEKEEKKDNEDEKPTPSRIDNVAAKLDDLSMISNFAMQSDNNSSFREIPFPPPDNCGQTAFS